MARATTKVSGGFVTFEYRGIKDASDYLWGTRGRARDLRPVWPAVGDSLASSMAAQFASAGSAGGAPWAPLKPDYRLWKIRHGYDPRTLVRTGRMMLSLIRRPMAVEKYFMARAEFGTDVPYYKFHHLGTRFMPRRRVMRVFEPFESQIERKITAYITGGVVG